MAQQFVNIAGYRFVGIPDRDELRQPFRDVCEKNNLLGTILLSTEGINFFLCGDKKGIDGFVEYLEQDERFVDIPRRISHSEKLAFRRMNVRLKKEIISMGMDDVKPAEFTGESISPAEFKQWMDEGRDITVLDTRNDYEIRIGTFENAVDFDINTFRTFPEAVNNSTLDKDKPLVMFCTGGVRCEKASVVMLNEGYRDVRQLEGGILGYFEQMGGAHWNGDCFVFDRRVAVDPELNVTGAEVCFACREPLTQEELDSPLYIPAVSCPYCKC
ncbi:MAG: rhodanese-like domain-containing protein [Candidatus Thalassarchaeaceae archaeon]|nr:rhodanese-like domain-containing protein [Candidatus Thalassarchaeaceae archaeon]